MKTLKTKCEENRKKKQIKYSGIYAGCEIVYFYFNINTKQDTLTVHFNLFLLYMFCFCVRFVCDYLSQLCLDWFCPKQKKRTNNICSKTRIDKLPNHAFSFPFNEMKSKFINFTASFLVSFVSKQFPSIPVFEEKASK